MADGAEMDYRAHEGTYGRFIGIVKVSIMVVAIITAIVVLLIAR